MNSRLTLSAATVAALALAVVPAHAATKAKAKPKPKPKPITGSYTLTLVPDPSPNATNEAPKPVKKEGCAGVSPKGKDDHPFKVPAAGVLHVVLDSPDPTGAPSAGPAGQVGTDWDLYVLDSDGSVLDASHGATSHEETTDKFKKGQPVTFEVCNLAGQPSGTVTYTFTYA